MKYLIIILTLVAAEEVFSQPEQKYIRQGNGKYNEQQYNEAEVLYRKALEENIQSRKAEYNLSNTLYKQEKYDAAAAKYLGLTQEEKDRHELSRYYYNLGNSMFKANKLKESIEAYKNALRNNPEDDDARHNLQLALRMKSQQEKQDNKEGQDNQDNQENKDQQDKQDNQNNQPDQEQQQNQQQGQISREDAERLLQALENDEKKVLQKVKENQAQVKKIPVEKDW